MNCYYILVFAKSDSLGDKVCRIYLVQKRIYAFDGEVKLGGMDYSDYGM